MVPLRRFVKALRYLVPRAHLIFPHHCPNGTPVVFRRSITGAAPLSEMDFITGRAPESSASHCRGDGRLEFNARWYNSDVNFDGFADSGAPADVFGAKQTDRNLILSGTYDQPLDVVVEPKN